MKVSVFVCLVVQVLVSAVTVPPSWIKYQHPKVTTQLPTLEITRNFYPKDTKPFESVQLQYRIPQRQIHILHPTNEKHTPQSYQIVQFDNQKDVPIFSKHKTIRNNQHLTEINPPVIKVSSLPHVRFTNQHLLVPENVQKTQPNHQNSRKNQRNQVKQDTSETKSTPVYSSNKNERNNQEIEYVSDHEQPKEIPTKPIYPGEGQWAKYGLKHRPYIRPKQNQQNQQQTNEEETPEGYETFEKGQQQFKSAQSNFEHDIASLPSKTSSNEDESLDDKRDLGYVPEKLYAQVRRSESVQHLPRSSLDPEQEEAADRLREVVKDSRIHTVYTEEGYEDTAYDHAGHEKQAENHEGYGEKQTDEHGSKGRSNAENKGEYNNEKGRKRGGDHLRRKIQRNNRNRDENYEHKETYKQKQNNEEEETAASNIEPQKLNITTITLNKNNQSINMEIHTEIKLTPQKKKHKFIKIIPSVSKENETLKRVKRYDKEKLSQKYVRKRPSYYWKKTRTTSTERTVPQSRKNFEAAFKTHRPKLDEDYFEDLGVNAPKIGPEHTEKTTKKPQVKPTNKPMKKIVVTTTSSTTTTTTTSTSKPTTTTTVTTITSTENSDTVDKSTTIHPDLMNPELTTKAAKPATPKPPPVKIKKFKLKRTKRFTNDFPKLQVDLKEFTDVSKIKLSPPTPDLTHIKYPYYSLPKTHLHENSPLRYAEDMKNIPEKTENLSFYKSREHIQCPEIPNHINPIPDRVQHQEDETGEEIQQEVDLPRLKGLGDKIDCMKIKYFGENPLDSPFFKEDIIEQPVPFFEIKKLSKNSPDYLIFKDKTNKKRELKIQILEPIVVLDDDISTMNPIHSKTEAVLKPPSTLQEMMSMQEKITPKSIYDQISILESQDSSKKENNSPPEFIILYDNQATVDKNDTVETTTQTKPYTIKPQIKKRPMMAMMSIKKLPVKTIKKPQPKTTTTTTTTTTVAPTTTPYTPPTLKPLIKFPQTPKPLRKLISPTVPSPIAPKILPKPLKPRQRPNPNWQSTNRQIAAFYNIFDISKFLPRVPDTKLINDNYRKFMTQQKLFSEPVQTTNTENNEQSDSKTVPVTLNTPEKHQSPTESIMNQDQMPEANQPMSVYIFDYGPEIQHRIVKRSNIFKDEEDLIMEETENKATYTRPQYTEIRRARPSRPKDSEEEEDLNPRKRVYELKSSGRTTTESPAAEEIEEIAELIEETPTTTPEPKIYPVEANKQDPNIAQYIFFIEKLHNKWAKEDATTTTTTTEQPTEKTTQTQPIIAESVNVRRGEPAYLQIINQLHEIRKEEDDKTTTTTTSTTEETSVVPQKNSNPFLPDFMSELNNMRTTLDSNAESSNIETTRNRNYSNRFRTNIDTSKYKTIERAPVQLRHNFSSRFNSENQELPLQKDKTTQEPMIIAIIRPQSTTPSSKDTTMSGSTIDESSTTTTVRTRTRGRFRGRSTTTTEKPTTSTTSTRSSTIQRRRRPVVSTTTTTTTKPEVVARRRRPLQKIQISTEKSKNYKENYTTVTTPQTVEDLVIVTPSNNNEEPKKQRRFQKVQERHIMSEVTLTRFYEPDSSEEDLEETKKHQYEVIGPLKNTDSLHGGNYKHEKDKKLVNTSETYYTDTSLAENVNNLTEPDKNKDLEKEAQSSVHSKIGVYPMAKMVNKLADVNIEDISEESETEKPVFIKDPSRRMYYYARL